MGSGVIDWLAHRRMVMPGTAALVDGECTASYAELDARVDRVAAALWESGVRPGGRVAMLAWNAPEVVELAHATWRLGAVLVPLNARLTVPELAFQLRDADVALLVCDDSLAEVAAAAAQSAGTPAPVRFPLVGTTKDFERAEWHADDDPMCIMYTSGTTGAPKGVVLTFGNMIASATGSAFNLGVMPGDRWLACVPLFHIAGLSIVVRCVLYGSTLVLHRSFDEHRLSESLRRDGVTHVSLVATMLQRLMAFDNGACPGALRVVLVGGGPVAPDLLRTAADRGYPVVQTYGLTETASQVATLSPEEATSRIGSAGKPLVTTRLRIDAGPGEAGEILVSGAVVMKEYFRRPEATAKALRDGWLHTGDVGRLDGEGYLYVLDRREDLIIRGGENVYPAEVEAVLLAHPAVREAAVVGEPSPAWGQQVVAVVVADEGLRLDDLRAWLEPRLARFKLPARIERVDALPRTASGKVLRREVRAQLDRS